MMKLFLRKKRLSIGLEVKKVNLFISPYFLNNFLRTLLFEAEKNILLSKFIHA